MKPCLKKTFPFLLLFVGFNFLVFRNSKNRSEDELHLDYSMVTQTCAERMNLKFDENTSSELKIRIAYFVFLPNNTVGRVIVKGQMEDMKKSGLIHRRNTEIRIVVASQSLNELSWANNFFQAQNKSFQNKLQVLTINENLYEFPGIRLLWEWACREPDAIYIYFHNKGVTHTDGTFRTNPEKFVFFMTITRWRSIITLFQTYPYINHTGIAPSPQGFEWFNFFWARGHYLNQIVQPIQTRRRHYYEDWLGSQIGPKETSQCFRKPFLFSENFDKINLNVLTPIDQKEEGFFGPTGFSLFHCSNRSSPIAEAVDIMLGFSENLDKIIQ